MLTYISMLFSTIFVSNVVLATFYGICPFLGVSTKRKNALSMGLAVIFVIVLSAIVTWAINAWVLVPNGLEYLQTIIFILVIAALVQFVEMILKRFSPAIYQALGIYLPLITTNCAVLGVAIDATKAGYGFTSTVVYALGVSAGYALVIYIFSAIREQIATYPIKKNYAGIPIALITAFGMALAFLGFGGMIG